MFPSFLQFFLYGQNYIVLFTTRQVRPPQTRSSIFNCYTIRRMTIRLKGSTLLTKYLDRMGFGSLLQNLFFLRTCPVLWGACPSSLGCGGSQAMAFTKPAAL